MEEFLIKNTTRHQREEIVKQALGYSDVGCDDSGGSFGYDMYQSYIDGEKELNEITMAYRANYVHGDMQRPMRSDCGYQK